MPSPSIALSAKTALLDIVEIDGNAYFKMANFDALRPFFMNIVSDTDHWLFVSSQGGITAGRKNAAQALFPYYTEDKLTDMAAVTGSKTLLRVWHEGKNLLWEPFTACANNPFQRSRNLYKSVWGNALMFEEINHTLGLTYRYGWESSAQFGFVKSATLYNHSAEAATIRVIDGLQNILPAHVDSDLQNAFSNLVDAYKRSELDRPTGVGIYALSARIVDRAEPSESLHANTVWASGLDPALHLLSALQLPAFREGGDVYPETDIKGERGAYFIQSDLVLAAQQAHTWHFVAEVQQSQRAVSNLIHRLRQPASLIAEVLQDVAQGTTRLRQLNAAADGIMRSADPWQDYRHFANVLFNSMRGGIFDQHYKVEKTDFERYLAKANKKVYAAQAAWVAALPATLAYTELVNACAATQDKDLLRLGTAYLPLKFSRRHGDPSRPWNKFSINLRTADGHKLLDYEGNWRDIFQNWEALVHSYPLFIGGMIAKFLNTSTFDGYNPYRVTKDGYDWEVIHPDDPWSYIGYWGDHQLIYLLKLLEFAQHYAPTLWAQWQEQDFFVYAAVPYKIKPYQAILKDPKDTIAFDRAWDTRLREQRTLHGADGTLLTNANGHIHHVGFVEKLLATLLAKLSNLVPDGGIWMNTQRPEWNDANNALVGNGLSMVTLYYLRRFLHFFSQWLAATATPEVRLSEELATYYHEMQTLIAQAAVAHRQPLSDVQRRALSDAWGNAAATYRAQIYEKGFSGSYTVVSVDSLQHFVRHALHCVDAGISKNERPDGLFHAYSILHLQDNTSSITHLSEMLEGQVAILSAGYLTADQSLAVLDALRSSALYRPDQHSYILYPNKDLPTFLQKNNLTATDISTQPLLKKLWAHGNTAIIEQDDAGNYYFNAQFKNAADLTAALAALPSPFAEMVAAQQADVLARYEKVFHHKFFTGRSGTFFGYEGLGSIYWHMVSKLLLAVQEVCLRAMESHADPQVISRLVAHYYDIKAGIGVHKPPAQYGAFPTDPYSHTPAHRGAQQPGMTGQVKEDILVQWGEWGVYALEGVLHFQPRLLRRSAFLAQATAINYIGVDGVEKEISLPADALFFTYCQVPIVYELGSDFSIHVQWKNGQTQAFASPQLDVATTQAIIARTGAIVEIKVIVPNEYLQP